MLGVTRRRYFKNFNNSPIYNKF